MVYKEMTTNETVYEEDALDYVCKKCGISFEYVEDNKEQLELKDMLLDWYFSGNWVKEVEEQQIDLETARLSTIADMIYERNLDKEMGLV